MHSRNGFTKTKLLMGVASNSPGVCFPAEGWCGLSTHFGQRGLFAGARDERERGLRMLPAPHGFRQRVPW